MGRLRNYVKPNITALHLDAIQMLAGTVDANAPDIDFEEEASSVKASSWDDVWTSDDETIDENGLDIAFTN